MQVAQCVLLHGADSASLTPCGRHFSGAELSPTANRESLHSRANATSRIRGSLSPSYRATHHRGRNFPTWEKPKVHMALPAPVRTGKQHRTAGRSDAPTSGEASTSATGQFWAPRCSFDGTGRSRHPLKGRHPYFHKTSALNWCYGAMKPTGLKETLIWFPRWPVLSCGRIVTSLILDHQTHAQNQMPPTQNAKARKQKTV